MRARVRLRTLGELRLEGGDGRVPALRRKERVLLAYLARHGGVATRTELATLLWGERDEASARHSLRQAIFSLRRALGDAVEVDAAAVRLAPRTVELDLDDLEAHASAGLPAAVFAAWRGEFMADVEDGRDGPLRAWITAERAGLHALLERALEAWLLDPSAHGAERLDAAARLARAHPWDERAQTRLVRALVAEGRNEQAVEAHARALERIRGELGIEPSAEFLRLGVDVAPVPAHAAPAAMPRRLELHAAVERLLLAWRGAPGEGVVAFVESDPPAAADACSSLAHAVTDGLVLRAAGSGAGDEPWSVAARLLADLRQAPGLSGVDDAALAETARIVPTIRARYPGLPAPRGGDDALIEAVVRTLGEVADEIPVLVMVEQPAAADPASRRLISALSAARPASVMLVLTGTRQELALLDLARAPTLRLELVPPPAGRVPRAARRRVLALAGGLAIALIAFVAASLARPGRAPPVMAVGTIRAVGLDPADPTPVGLPELLSMRLADTDGLEVVSRARMQELLARTSGDLAAARAARAALLLHGDLYRDDAGYRLELRQVDIATGRLKRALTVRAGDGGEIASEAAASVARGFGVEPAAASIGGNSVQASALYEQGLRAMYRGGDLKEAFALLSGAFAEDSTYAMAALLAAYAASVAFPDSMHGYFDRAETLAPALPDHDRLSIIAQTATFYNEPRARAVAETLAIRYPADPTGAMLYGDALTAAGDFLNAVAQYRRAKGLDPALTGSRAGSCPTCSVYAGLVSAYMMADSVEAAVAVAREIAERQPDQALHYVRLAEVLDYAGRYEESAAARQQAARLRPAGALDDLYRVQRLLRAGDFHAADRLLDVAVLSEDPTVAAEALWWQVINLRYQGRFAEALAAAERYHETYVPPTSAAGGLIPLGVTLQESGRPDLAIAVFDSIHASLPAKGRTSRLARDQAWWLTHAGTAAAMAGDTVRLARLADSVRTIGARSGYGRDQRLHHHLRGLLLRARGDLAGAEAELRAALYSTTAGYTRTNLELARVLIERGRPDDAIPLLQAALRGPLEGSPLYVSRTELHETIAHAWADAGRPDSAAYHYSAVLHAWQNADPQLHARRYDTRRRMEALR